LKCHIHKTMMPQFDWWFLRHFGFWNTYSDI
jgi:hypothetical protein